METLSYLELAEKVIREEKQALSSNEIWDIAQKKGYVDKLKSQGKTPEATLGARLYTDVKNQNSIFGVVGDRPKRFYLKNNPPGNIDDDSADPNIQPVPQKTDASNTKILEKHLHPFLVYFANQNLDAYCKTIDHTKSNKKSFGEWLHPDIVGCHFYFEDWDSKVSDLHGQIGSSAIKLFSFELKRELDFNNLRESFFQAVSNSSWANEAYLVAEKIDENPEFRDELRRLSTSFGVGIIKLDTTKNPDDAEILYPAKTREYLDWDNINKLSKQNPDFHSFIVTIGASLKGMKVHDSKFDEIYEAEELLRQHQLVIKK